MKRTVLGRMGAAALLVTGMTIGSTATAVIADAAPVSTNIHDALQRDLGLSPAQAEARLRQ
jgi:streptogrisin C